MHRTPPRHVLEAFGLSGPVVAITPTVWWVGSSALERVEHPAAVEWLAELMRGRDPGGHFRLSHPIPSADGRWVVDGWSASTWLEGEADGSRWREILDVGDAFHSWLADVERPAWIDQIDDPWRQADRAAWAEGAADLRPRFQALVEELISMKRPVALTSQLVHGDLSGNVLFADGLPPGVIDLSLYWRPGDYAAAIVAVDSYEWEGAGAEVLEHVASRPDGGQLLVRAALFRIVRTGMVDWADPGARLEVHRRTVSSIRSLLE